MLPSLDEEEDEVVFSLEEVASLEEDSFSELISLEVASLLELSEETALEKDETGLSPHEERIKVAVRRKIRGNFIEG